jgi:group I intron endonuclease
MLDQEIIAGVYILNFPNGKKYIGQSQDIIERLNEHQNSAFKTNPSNKEYDRLLYRAIRKYKWENIQFEILEICENYDLRLQREIFYIAFYKTNKNKYGNKFGYNLTDGGQGPNGMKFSEVSKEKMRQARIKFIQEHPEHKLVMSKAHKEYFKNLTIERRQELKNIQKQVYINNPKKRLKSSEAGKQRYLELNPTSKNKITKTQFKKGETPFNRKFTYDQANQIRLEHQTTGISAIKLSKKYNTSQPTISKILNNQTYITPDAS